MNQSHRHGERDCAQCVPFRAIRSAWVRAQLVDDSTVNAFAGYADKKPTVAVTFGLLDAVNPTDAEFAALLGHEFAHFALRHYEHRTVDPRGRKNL